MMLFVNERLVNLATVTTKHKFICYHVLKLKDIKYMSSKTGQGRELT